MSPARKVKGIVGTALSALRYGEMAWYDDPEYAEIVHELIGRTPNEKSPITDAEVLGIAYVMALDEFAPKIHAGANRAVRRSKL